MADDAHGILVGSIEGQLIRAGFSVENLRDSDNRATGDLAVHHPEGDVFIIHVVSKYEAASAGYIELADDDGDALPPPSFKRCENCGVPAREVFPLYSGGQYLSICRKCAVEVEAKKQRYKQYTYSTDSDGKIKFGKYR